MSFQYVVARYNEDINWLRLNYTEPNKGIAPIILYNKGESIEYSGPVIALPNVGREAHTYLYHIVNNYDNLADITVFTQAKVWDHMYRQDLNYLQNLLVESAKEKHYSRNLSIASKGQYKNYDPDFNVQIREALIKICKIPEESVDKIVFREWFEKHIEPTFPDPLRLYQGAIFAVSKQQILTRSRDYYRDLLNHVDKENNPIEAHFFERSWFYVFNCHKL